MARYREVRNYKTSGWVIRLRQQDIDDLNIKEGDAIDIEASFKKFSLPKELNTEPQEPVEDIQINDDENDQNDKI